MALHRLEEVLEVLVKSIAEESSRLRVETLDNAVNHILVDLAELVETGGIWHLNEPSVLVDTRNVGVNIKDFANERLDIGELNGARLTMEAIGHPVEVEEVASFVDAELLVEFASVAEEEERKDGLGIGTENAGGGENEFGVGSLGLFDELPSEFSSSVDVVRSVSELVGKRDELEDITRKYYPIYKVSKVPPVETRSR